MDIESTLTRSHYMKLNLLMVVRSGGFYFAMTPFCILLILGLLLGNKAIFFALGYLVFMILVYTISILHMGLSSKNRNFFLKRQFTFNDENVLVKTPIVEEVLKWEAIINWRKMGGYYLLYFSSGTFLVIRKPDIPANNITAFENLLSRKINTKVSRGWTWKTTGLLIFIVILSLIWLFITLAASAAGDTILGGIPGIYIATVAVVPVVILVVEWYFLMFNKRPSSRRGLIILSSLSLLTIIGMIAVILDILIFGNFMY